MLSEKLKGRRGILLALAALPLILSLPCFFGMTWAAGDLIRQFHPWKELGQQAMASGHWPLWNSYAYCGMPLAGNFQSGLFYPLHFYFYFLPFAPALGIHLGLHAYLSGAGFYVLARGFKLSPSSALLAALAWGGNSFFLARVEFMAAFCAYAWTPWILAAFVRGWSWQAVAFLIGMQALAGYPLELGFTFGASLLLNLTASPLAEGRGEWKRFAFSWAVGLLMGSLVLLPGIELFRQSSRAAGLADAAQNYRLQLGDLKAWFLGVPGTPWAKLFSISLASLCLLPLARGRVAWLGLGFCLLGLLLSFGILNPSFNRHPTLALVWLSLGVALLTGAGAEKVGSYPFLFLAGLCLVLQPLLFSSLNLQLISSSVYKPQPAAMALASKISPQRRYLLSPAVQEERNTGGASLTAAWTNFPGWMQANTALPLKLKDANGYDPLAPANIVAKLNAVSFPQFAADNSLLDSLGVEALVDWRAPGEIAISKRKDGPVPRALFLKQPPSTAKDLRNGVALSFTEPWPEKLAISLPPKHDAGWVFINDTYYPGWKARVDGKPMPITQSLDAFRLLAVGKDAKEVILRYRPLSVDLGITGSLLAFLLILLSF